MSTLDNSQHFSAERSVEERRAGARREVRSMVYVELGEANGGTVLNVSEGGLALATAEPMADSHFARIHFRLPAVTEGIEAAGEITWISESKKRAGLRFVNLAAEAQSQLKEWVSSESNAEAETPAQQHGPRAQMVEEETRSVHHEEHAGAGNGKAAEQPPYIEPRIEESAPEVQPEVREFVHALDKLLTKSAAGKSSTHSEGASLGRIVDSAGDSERTANAVERRSSCRARVTDLVYVEAGASNGGALVDLSENGACVRMAKPLQAESSVKLRFRLPGNDELIEAEGLVLWRGKTHKTAGVQFSASDLSADAREQISTWISREIARAREVSESPVGKERPRLHGRASTDRQQRLEHEDDGHREDGVGAPVRVSTVRSAAEPQAPSAMTAVAEAPLVAGVASRQLSLSPLQPITAPAATKAPMRWWAFAAIAGLIGGFCFAAGMALAPRAMRTLQSNAARQVAQSPNGEEREGANSGTAGLQKQNAAPNASEAAQATPPVQSDSGASDKGEGAPSHPESTRSAVAASSQSIHTGSQTPDQTLGTQSRVIPGQHNTKTDVQARTDAVPRAGSVERQPNPASSRASNPISTGVSAGASDARQPKVAAGENSTGQKTAQRQQGTVVNDVPRQTSEPSQAQNAARAPAADAGGAITGSTAAKSASPAQLEATASDALGGKSTGATSPVASSELPTGTVASTTLFRSIRGAADMSAAGAQGGESLQIGKLVSSEEPAYPQEALAQHLQGRVELRARVRTDGTVQDVQVVNGPAGLTDAAAHAVLAWRFEPTLFGGEPVETERAIVLVFTLKNPSAH